MLSHLHQHGASDLLLKEGAVARMKVDDAWHIMSNTPIAPEFLKSGLSVLLSDTKIQEFNVQGEIDFSYTAPDASRFRGHVYKHMSKLAMVFRVIPSFIRTLSELRCPEKIGTFCDFRSGLILVCGPTGSGKSTTLASMIQSINTQYSKHIITIEDPIEFLFHDAQSVIEQREVGQDTLSFQYALRASLRQNPDVIFLGEIRDVDTMKTALMAAETGHLVMSTLHTSNVSDTLQRIYSYFSTEQIEVIKQSLAKSLRAIVCQKLIPKPNGKGQQPIHEILVNNLRVKELIESGASLQMFDQVIADSHTSDGMQSFDHAITALLKNGQISESDALAFANNPQSIRLFLQQSS